MKPVVFWRVIDTWSLLNDKIRIIWPLTICLFTTHCTCRAIQVHPPKMDSFHFPPDILLLNESTPFGPNLLPYFQMEAGYTNLNFGSDGAPPRIVSEALRHYHDRMERRPDGWFRYESEQQVNRVIDELRTFVNVNDGDLVLVQNTTFAMNCIFRAWPWKKGDKLLFLSEAYEMIKLAANFLNDSLGVEVVEVPIKFPISDDSIIELVANSLATHRQNVKMAIFSHVSSMPAVILPIDRLIDLCRDRGIACVIDGAHALGQIDVDMTQLDPDFYIASCHKWLMAAKGAGFLYAKKKWRPNLHSAVITVGYGDEDARKEFFWEGTADYSPWFTVSTAIKFRRLLGENRIRNYCRKLAKDAGRTMAEIWGTEVLVMDENQLGSMNNIRLPLGEPMPIDPAAFVHRAIKELFMQYKTYLHYFCQDGIWYARISAQIYNNIDDYKMVAHAWMRIIDQIKTADR